MNIPAVDKASAQAGRNQRGWVALLPIFAFMALALLFVIGLGGGDPNKLPSALIGKQAPAMVLPAIEGVAVPGFDMASLQGEVVWVNIWASWCVPCRDEYPQLQQLAKTPGLVMAGIDYKDKAENAASFIGTYGNPFSAIGYDEHGRAGIEWGVTGVPESFLIDRAGVIIYKFTGPITTHSLEREILPKVNAALAQ